MVNLAVYCEPNYINFTQAIILNYSVEKFP